jgi:glycosyltransferase involved in cell wall biosynthesis
MVPLDKSLWVEALDDWLNKASLGQLDASANRESAKHHSWQLVTEQYLQVYKQSGAPL